MAACIIESRKNFTIRNQVIAEVFPGGRAILYISNRHVGEHQVSPFNVFMSMLVAR